jgi:nicotinate phosphoribosyltransferase
VIEYLSDWHFTSSDVDYLGTLCGADGNPLFDAEFLRALSEISFDCDMDAVPEGTLVFPNEPLVRVQGPLWQAQIIETALLNILNFQTLVATKAARICREASGESVMEFGLRRAQGIDGSLSASRAAYIGGCSSSSNVLAGKLYGIPVRGTHAHSWVMAFGDERTAFEAYAQAMPNNCVFLVDTYDTLKGVHHAVEAGKILREQGHEMLGIRLDSGDLTELSRRARQILDDNGFPNAFIVGSNDLDEYLVRDLKQQGSAVNTWGIGTRLVTAYDQPALGGVYKLAVIRSDAGDWEYRIKISEQKEKTSNPGIQQVRRYFHKGELIGDVIYDELQGIDDQSSLATVRQNLSRPWPADELESKDLLVPVFRKGQLVYDPPSIHAVRSHVQQEIGRLPGATQRLANPTPIPVLLEGRLESLKQKLTAQARRGE